MFPRTVQTWATYLLQKGVILLLLATGMPTGALAHAVLSSSSPASNEILAKPPADVKLHFNEPVRIIRATATDAKGVSKDLASKTAGADVSLSLPEAERGTVIVSYRVESEDGHPVGGSLVFHIGSPSTGAGDVSSKTAARSLMAAIWLVHALTVLYLAAVVGGSVFSRWLGSDGVLRTNSSLVILPGIVLLIVGLYVRGLDELGLGLAFAGIEPLIEAASGGSAISAALILFSLVAVSLPLGGSSSRAVSIIALATLASAFAYGGHSGVASPYWLAKAAIFLHNATLVSWIGSLLPLWRLSQIPRNQISLRRFSRAIPLPFLVLIAAGATLAFIELPNIGQIFASLWGRVLVVKIGLVTALCVLAAYNRFWLTGPALDGDLTAGIRLRRSIGCEIVLAIAIVGAASLWRFGGPQQLQFTPPPRAISLHLHSEKAMAQIELGGQPDGLKSINVAVMGPDFGMLESTEVILRLKNPQMGVEPMKFELAKAPQGGWMTTGLPIGDPRGWLVDVEVLVDDFTSVHLEGCLAN
ncbi:copper resistance CopC/CopD family protein [Rhizobium sp. LjRoot258]|uniref:copper resistance CopC/CopD family protein n=1 Tax=Rhizobium sp. LjRoot258 TaxID=3342299 RepID=UPI003ECF19B9